MKAFVTALALAAAALPAVAGVTKDDVKKLAAAKLGDDVILAFILAVYFRLISLQTKTGEE